MALIPFSSMNIFRLVFVVGSGLLFSVLGTLRLLSTFRTVTALGPADEPTTRSIDAVKANGDTSLRKKRISGTFWLCLGVATLAISSDRESWGLPVFGLLWAAMVHYLRVRVGVSPTVVAQPHRQGEDGRLAEIVTQHVERAFNRTGHIGLVVGAIARDEEVLLGYGARRLRGSQPPDADTVFEIGSISKVFTGILLAERIENGELALDDRIADLLPKGWSLSESASPITLRHCTTHTSGLPRLPANLLGITDVLSLAFVGGDPHRDYTEEEFRHALATVELEFAPGTRHRYSNFAVGLLGFVLAAKDGSDYESLATRGICRPLGMHRTVIANGRWHGEQMPAKYRTSARLGPVRIAAESDEWRFPNHLAGAGAFRSTGRDMMTFLKANMGLIPTPIDAEIRRSHQELFQEHAHRAIGMNWIRSFENTLSQRIIWHNGRTGGFRTYLGFTEDRQFGVFVLSNTANSVDALASGILKALVTAAGPGAG